MAATHAGAICFGDADHGLNRIGRNAGADHGSAGGGAGGCHKRIRAMVDIEHGRLRAFEHHGLARGHRLIEEHRGIGDKGCDFFRGFRIFAIHAFRIKGSD